MKTMRSGPCACSMPSTTWLHQLFMQPNWVVAAVARTRQHICARGRLNIISNRLLQCKYGSNANCDSFIFFVMLVMVAACRRLSNFLISYSNSFENIRPCDKKKSNYRRVLNSTHTPQPVAHVHARNMGSHVNFIPPVYHLPTKIIDNWIISRMRKATAINGDQCLFVSEYHAASIQFVTQLMNEKCKAQNRTK